MKRLLIDTVSMAALILGTILIFGGAIYLLITFWDSFLSGFCKVGVVCWQGSPNWLGWILVTLLGLLVLVACIFLWIRLLAAIAEEEEIWLQ